MQAATQTAATPLNESPSEKEGKLVSGRPVMGCFITLNESPSEKEGKFRRGKRTSVPVALNESPSEKEGKYDMPEPPRREALPSMKVPTKK